MLSSRAPGAYYQSVDAGAPPVTPYRTDIVGFVGIAERGPVDVPIPVQSWRQFASWFGGFTAAGFLAYAVRAFFENGGRRCWVVRVASTDPAAGATAAAATFGDATGPVWRVCASSPGGWGDALDVAMHERNRAQTVVTGTSADGRYSVVADLNGLRRGTLVRLSQAGLPAGPVKVVSEVDPHTGRLYWTHPVTELRLPYDRPLTGVDPAATLVVRSVEYALTVEQSGRPVAFYDGLALVPEHPDYGPRRLAAPRLEVDPATGEFVSSPPEPVVVEELRTDLSHPGPLDTGAGAVRCTGGRDGLTTLSVADFVGEPVAPDDGTAAVAVKCRGMRTLEGIREVVLLAVPDAQPRPVEAHPTAVPPRCMPDPCRDEQSPAAVPRAPAPSDRPPAFGTAELFAIQSAMVDQCEGLRRRFAILDPPFAASADPAAGIRGAQEWRSRFDSTRAALYFPWLRVLDPGGAPGSTRLTPPSGHVAGTFAATDLEAGVHRAPANRRLAWAVDASADVTDEQHAILNTAGVNVLRATGGRGLRVSGARTVSSDPDWRFLNVRRLLAMIEAVLEDALQWAVFEPNGSLTRARATMSITLFLLELHESGMLAGATPEESFLVTCDLDNNPPAQRDLGRLVVDIAVAPSRPFEFVLLRVGRVRDALEVVEPAQAPGGPGTGS